MNARTTLVAYRGSVVTPDTAEALRQLEINAAKMGGLRLEYSGVPKTEADLVEGHVEPYSMRPTGREVYLRFGFTDDFNGSNEERLQAQLETLWSIAVPLGFTPWLRHPVCGQGHDIFHFLGPWHLLYDSLCGEGRGEMAWPSVCAAAQTDVGTWGGSKPVERFVQGQLHRLGLPCGPVDGNLGERTASALHSLSLQGQTLEETAQTLSRFRAPPVETRERRIGHVILPGDDVRVSCYGGVASLKTKGGVTLTVDGPGRAVIDIPEV